MRHKITICVDFDGTMVYHEYPYIGKENDNCSALLKHWIKDYDCGIILDSMRPKKLLADAVKWCEDRGIELYGIGKNPTQEEWTDSNKAYGIFSIDDRNVGCPLKFEDGKRPRVDWEAISEILEPVLKRLSEKKR